MASKNNPTVSTGRGGAGNIGKDIREYVDGEVVREAVVGESDKPEYSSGASIIQLPSYIPLTAVVARWGR
jgi:hypothetical protein